MASSNKLHLAVIAVAATVLLSKCLASNNSNGTYAITSKGLPDIPSVPNINKLINDTEYYLLSVLRNMTGYLPLNVVYAETVGRNCNIVAYNSSYYSVPGLVIAGLMVVIGVLFSFLGYRLIKVNLFILGFVAGGAFVYLLFLGLLSNVQGDWKIYVAIGLAVVIGVISGIISVCIYYVGIFLAGGSIGCVPVWLLLSAIDIPYFQSHVYIPILIALGAGLITGIIALLLQKWLIIIGTSLIGPLLIVVGLDYFIELGQGVYFLVLFAAERERLHMCWFAWILVALLPILVTAGLLLQIFLTGRKYDHKKDFKGICCGQCKRCRKERSNNYVPLRNIQD